MTTTLTAEPTVAVRMTHRPIAVPADASFHEIAAILSGDRIGAVPVLDEHGLLAGAVTERDLIRAGLRAPQGLTGLTARDLMAGTPVTVSPDLPVSTAVRLLGKPGTHRVFVVEDGRLVGVLSRRDLLRDYARSDDDIRVQIEQVVQDTLPDGTIVRAAVEDGIVLLVGRVEWRSALADVERLTRAVPGVVEVRNRVRYVWDDNPVRSRR